MAGCVRLSGAVLRETWELRLFFYRSFSRMWLFFSVYSLRASIRACQAAE